MNKNITLDDYISVINMIYNNRYFTNHGPLAQELELEIEKYCDFNNIVTIGSDVLALLIVLKGVVGKSKILIPGTSHQNISDAVSMSGVNFQFYSENQLLQQDSNTFFQDLLTEDVASILLFETEVKKFDALFLNNIVNFGVKLIVYSENTLSLNLGRNLSEDITFVYPLIKCLNTTILDGGIIATNSNHRADIFRNIRSSYGVRDKVDVLATCNGRFSELQAGLAMIFFKKLFKKQLIRKAKVF